MEMLSELPGLLSFACITIVFAGAYSIEGSVRFLQAMMSGIFWRPFANESFAPPAENFSGEVSAPRANGKTSNIFNLDEARNSSRPMGRSRGRPVTPEEPAAAARH